MIFEKMKKFFGKEEKKKDVKKVVDNYTYSSIEEPLNKIVRGRIEKNAPPVNSSTIIIDGKQYKFPCKVSELLADGWELYSEFDGNPLLKQDIENGVFKKENVSSSMLVPPREIYPVVRLFLLKGDNSEIKLKYLYNPNSQPTNIKDCYVLVFMMFRDFDSNLYVNGNAKRLVGEGIAMHGDSFVLPGGVTPDSTYADVVEIYGEPGSSTLFTKNPIQADEEYLTYCQQIDSNLSFYIKLVKLNRAHLTEFKNKVYWICVEYNGYVSLLDE